MFISKYPPIHSKHLALDPLRLGVLPITSEAIGQIRQRAKPLVNLVRLIAQQRPPRFRQPRSHRPRETLLARLALPPHHVASKRLL
jgi:hypothetical protein